MNRCYFFICILFSLWTILQTIPHLVFVIYAYFLDRCIESPTNTHTIFFYLTYLFKKSCKIPTLNNPTLSTRISMRTWSNLENYFSSILQISPLNTTATDIVQILLHKIDKFPDQANATTRTATYLLMLIILDVTWLTAAVALLMGTLFHLKNSLSLFFNVPWLVMTALYSLFDVVTAIQFGYDAAETTNFANWLRFVGANPRDFPELDQPLPILWTMFPALSICLISGRFLIIWLVNWTGFFFVLKAAVAAYRKKAKSTSGYTDNNNSFSSDSQNQFNSSAARIRNWQLFYGAIEATSTRSGSEKSSEKTLEESLGGVVNTASGNYYAYSDVADGVLPAEARNAYELRNHLPWSYTRNGGGGGSEASEDGQFSADSTFVCGTTKL